MSKSDVYIFTNEEKDLLTEINNNISGVKSEVEPLTDILNVDEDTLNVGGKLIAGGEYLRIGDSTVGMTIKDEFKGGGNNEISFKSNRPTTKFYFSETELMGLNQTQSYFKNNLKVVNFLDVGGGVVAGGSVSANLLIGREKGVIEKLQVGDNNIGFTTTQPNDLTINGNALITDYLRCQGEVIINNPTNGEAVLNLGSGSLSDDSDLTLIKNQEYEQNKTELLLYKGNNTGGTHGPDRIRLKGGNIVLETYPFLEDNETENSRNNLIIDSDGHTTINGNLTVNGLLTGHEEDYTKIFDDLINERNAVIAHRFSKNTAQPYSLSLLRNIIDRGVRLIEFDVEETKDSNPADRVFYLSHGDMEEIAPEERPIEITKDTYNKSIINFNNQGLNNGDTLPSLKEAWDFLKHENVCILVEAKTDNAEGLLNYCQEIGLNPNRMIFQDFNRAQLNIFKTAGYKTMLIADDLNTTDHLNWTYLCCSSSAVAGFNSYPDVDKFLYYTNNDPYDFIDKKTNYNKLVGCFSDCVIPTLKQLKQDSRILLNPNNGFVSVVQTKQSNAKYTSIKMNERGHLNIDFKTKILFESGHNTIINFHGYKIKMGEFYTFKLDFGANYSSGDWLGVCFRLGADYYEDDTGATRRQALNIIFRGNGTVNTYLLKNGGYRTDPSTSRSLNNNYITFNINKFNSGNDMRVQYSFDDTPTANFIPDLTHNIEMGDLDGFNFNTNEEIYLTMKRDDTMNGNIEWYDRDYSFYKY